MKAETLMNPFEAKARDYYGEVVINKGLMGKAGFGARAIPVYVAEDHRSVS
jgi:ATP-dependent Lon protease